MTLDLYQNFLDQITDECFPCMVQERKIKERLFLKLHFHPNYANLQNKEIAAKMKKTEALDGDLIGSIPMTCQKVVRTIANQYSSEMQSDGVEMNPIFNKNNVGQSGPWQIVYSWLYNHKFPRWLTTDKIWQSWKAKVQPQLAKISFEEIPPFVRMEGSQPRQKGQLEMNQDFSMQIEIESSNFYLLLLNRGKSSQGEETRYLICPSSAFAPMLQPISHKIMLPQPESDFGAIKFTETGIEEYIGILVRNTLDNRIFESMLRENNSLPTWDVTGIYPLWQELEKEADCQFFYQSFEVVSN